MRRASASFIPSAYHRRVNLRAALRTVSIYPALNRHGRRNQHRMRAIMRWISFASTLALYACCGASPRPAANLNPAFARIQVEEARIDRSTATLDDAKAECSASCAAIDVARDAQAELCRVAKDIEDADALIRCERAARAVDRHAAGARERCRCETAGG